MRSLKELYGMVYEYIKDMPYISGLCYQIRLTYGNTDMSEKEIEMLQTISNLKDIYIQKFKLKNAIGILMRRHF